MAFEKSAVSFSFVLIDFSVCLLCEYHRTVTAIISALISVVILSSRKEN